MTPTPTQPLTPRQREVLDFIVAYFAEHGTPPTMQEIADHFDVSKTSVFENTDQLERKGWLTRRKHATRSMVPVTSCPGCGRAMVHEGTVTK